MLKRVAALFFILSAASCAEVAAQTSAKGAEAGFVEHARDWTMRNVKLTKAKTVAEMKRLLKQIP